MINTKLKAVADAYSSAVYLESESGEGRVDFDNLALFYIVTGFKSVEAYNEHHADEPVKFLVWKQEN